MKKKKSLKKETCDMIEEEEIDDIEVLFHLKTNELYACNVCNEEFEKNNNINKHIQKDHYQVLLQIRKEIYEDADEDDRFNDKHKQDDSLDTVSDYYEMDGEDDEAFLTKIDDDRNLI